MSTNKLPEMQETDGTIFLYKWYIDFYNSNDDKAEHINPVYLDSFTMIKNYKNSNIPQILSRMKFRLKDIMTMKNWQKDCLVDITCKILVYSRTESNTMHETDSKIIFSTTFMPIFNSKTFKSKYKTEKIEEIDRVESSLETGETMVSMMLLNITAQNALKTVYNQIIEEGNTVGTAIQWLTCELPISGAIIDTPDNTGKQKDIIIPPMSYIQAMNFIQANYGIYENGLMIFYDIDGILYVLDKWSYEHDCVKGASTLTKIYDADESVAAGSIVRKCDKDGIPQYIGLIPVKRDNDEILKGELTGKTIVFSSFQQGLDSIVYDNEKEKVSSSSNPSAAITRNNPTSNVSGDKILTEYDELNNIYNMSSYFNEIESQTQKASVSLSNINVADFAPNVIIELEFEDIERNNEQSGQYFLNAAVFKFIRLKEADNVGLGSSNEDLKKYKHSPSITTCTVDINISKSN